MAHADTINPKALKRQRALEARRRQRLMDTYRAVLNTPQGRAVFEDIIVGSGWNDTAWSPSGMEIHRNIGRQEIGERLEKLIKEIDYELFLQMKREARSLAIRDANEETAGEDQDLKGSGVAKMPMEEPETP